MVVIDVNNHSDGYYKSAFVSKYSIHGDYLGLLSYHKDKDFMYTFDGSVYIWKFNEYFRDGYDLMVEVLTNQNEEAYLRMLDWMLENLPDKTLGSNPKSNLQQVMDLINNVRFDSDYR